MSKVDHWRAACAVSLNDNGWTRALLAGLTPAKISDHKPLIGGWCCVCSVTCKPTQPFWGLIAIRVSQKEAAFYDTFTFWHWTYSAFMSSDFSFVCVFIPSMLNSCSYNWLLHYSNDLHWGTSIKSSIVSVTWLPSVVSYSGRFRWWGWYNAHPTNATLAVLIQCNDRVL